MRLASKPRGANGSAILRGARPAVSSIRVLRAAVFVLALVPLARLFVLGVQDDLTANPVEFVQRSTGTWALAMLCITLSVTPLRRLLGWHSLARLRRMLGLFAFFYACLHLLAYAWLDQWFDWNAIVDDVLERPFITVGFTAFVLLIPLAATSTNAMMRRLGRRWQELHRLVYAIAVLAVLHYWWHKAGKNDFSAPLAWALVVAGLFALRLTWHWARPRAGVRAWADAQPRGTAPHGAQPRGVTRPRGTQSHDTQPRDTQPRDTQLRGVARGAAASAPTRTPAPVLPQAPLERE